MEYRDGFDMNQTGRRGLFERNRSTNIGNLGDDITSRSEAHINI